MWQQRHRLKWFIDKSRTARIPARTSGKHQKLEEARKNFLLQASEKLQPKWHLNFELLASRIVRQYIFVFLSHPVLYLATAAPGTLKQAPSWLNYNLSASYSSNFSLKMLHDYFWKSNLMYSSDHCSNCYI